MTSYHMVQSVAASWDYKTLLPTSTQTKGVLPTSQVPFLISKHSPHFIPDYRSLEINLLKKLGTYGDDPDCSYVK